MTAGPSVRSTFKRLRLPARLRATRSSANDPLCPPFPPQKIVARIINIIAHHGRPCAMDGCRAGWRWRWLKDERRRNVVCPKQQLNHPARLDVRPSWSFLEHRQTSRRASLQFRPCFIFCSSWTCVSLCVFCFHLAILSFLGLDGSSSVSSRPPLSSRGSTPPSLSLPLSSRPLMSSLFSLCELVIFPDSLWWPFVSSVRGKPSSRSFIASPLQAFAVSSGFIHQQAEGSCSGTRCLFAACTLAPSLPSHSLFSLCLTLCLSH